MLKGIQFEESFFSTVFLKLQVYFLFWMSIDTFPGFAVVNR